MAVQVQSRRGTEAEHETFTGAVGEVTVVTDKNTLRVHNGVKAGGFGPSEWDISVEGSSVERPLGEILSESVLTFSNLVDLKARVGEVSNGRTIYLDGWFTVGDKLSGVYKIGTSNTGGCISIGSGLFVVPKQSASRTLIQSGVSKVSLAANYFRGKQILITGDSLSFNGFGYPENFTVNGGGYAREQAAGLSSWAHLLRDVIITGNSFEQISETDFITDCITTVPTSSQLQYAALNTKLLTFTGGVTNKINIPVGYTGGTGLLIQTQPTESLQSFDVNGVTYTNETTDGSYKGRGFKVIPFGRDEKGLCKITNMTGSISIYGIVNVASKIPVITGKGAWTSTQILAEYNTLVAPYNPDVIYYIIGANDGGSGPEVSGYNTSVQAFIDRAKTDNPNVEIILISMPPTSTYSASLIQDYVHAGHRLAVKNSCSHIDLYTELLSYDPAEWRHDNIHANANGDTIWFNIIKRLTFPTLEVKNLVPQRQYIDNTKVAAYYKGRDSIGMLIKCGSGTPTIYTVSTPHIADLVKLEYTTMGTTKVVTVLPPKGYLVQSVVGLVTDPTGVNEFHQYQSAESNGTCAILRDRTTFAVVDPNGSNLYFYVTLVPSFVL